MNETLTWIVIALNAAVAFNNYKKMKANAAAAAEKNLAIAREIVASGNRMKFCLDELLAHTTAIDVVRKAKLK